MLHTKSHQSALDTLVQTGRLFFSGEQILPKIRLRLFLLIIAPTGAGKSFIMETASHRLQAGFFRITRGDWLVSGYKGGRPTMFQILDRLVAHERLLLLIDEIDKFNDLQNADWGAAIGSDLWNVLDGKFQVEEYLRETTFPGQIRPTPKKIERLVRSGLWIVGAGTFQEVFESGRAGATVGFGGAKNAGKVGREAIAQAKMISPELLHRFNGDPIFLEYPSLEETQELLLSSGITQLAKELNVSVGAEQIDWARGGGMRALQTIASRLVLAQYRKKYAGQSEFIFAPTTNFTDQNSNHV